MALFNRDKKATIAELEEYYENQRNNRSGRAWVMALFSLIITVGVIAGLFIGGRWTYRQLTKEDTKTAVVNGNDKENSLVTDTSKTDTATPAVEPGGVVSNSAATTSVPNSTTAVNTPAVVAKSSTAIPNTGSGSILLTFPIVSVAVGYAIARRRELNNL